MRLLIILLLLLPFSLFGQAKDETLQKPLVERFILDELRDMRKEQHMVRADMQTQLAKINSEQTDRSARYVTDVVGNIFYLIAAATSLLIFAGWSSFRDIRKKTQETIENRLDEITVRYNKELEALQERLGEQSSQIIKNQKNIYNTQLMHSLWMRANLETNLQSKIEIYDEILKLNKNDAEVYAYKADAVLDLDEYEWALNLSNKAIEIDDTYGYAYWQRACANAKLNNLTEAVMDIKTALQAAPNLRDEIHNEPSFDSIRETPEFQEVIA